ncbi:MAG: twin-arginine translocation signal domain-containing protein, partial [Coriobacteriales bacterium]|nr:twin-arginine translocation signal domain-containing protein [Coriobacteriales bacterium]
MAVELNRRNFLKGAGVVGGAAALSGAAALTGCSPGSDG